MVRIMVKLLLLIINILIISGCLSTSSPTQLPMLETVSPTINNESILTFIAPTKSPQPTATSQSRTLIVCLDGEPETLYPFRGRGLAQRIILDAVYDGPIDYLSYRYQPVILEKLPNLADGDAIIQPILVGTGDKVVDVNGNVVTLKMGVSVLPSGCLHQECNIKYENEGTIQMDQLIVTFTMKTDIKWSDGEPLTANDSVYSYHLESDPNTPTSKFKIERTASYVALDDLNTQWTGLPGYMDQNYFLNFWTPYPEHVWSEYTAMELLEAETSSINPIGWGPYVIKKWRSGEYIQLQKNPNYFRADEGLPKFDKLVYRFIPTDARGNIDLLLSGECDILSQEVNLNDEIKLLTELESEGSLNAEFANGPAWEHIDFAIRPVESWDGFSRSGAFQEANLRRAIALCLDRQRLVDEIFFGQSVVLDTYLPPEHPLFNQDTTHYEFDIYAGSNMLEKIGWIDDDSNPATPRIYRGTDDRIMQGIPLEFNYWISPTYYDRQQIAHVLANSLAQCGIRVNLEIISSANLYAPGPGGPIAGRQFDITQFSWAYSQIPLCDLFVSQAIPGDQNTVDINDLPLHPFGWVEDPANLSPDRVYWGKVFPFGWGAWNITGYSNPKYDQVCKDALALLPGQLGYDDNHLEAQVIFAFDLPIIPLIIRPKVSATRYDMCGYILDSTAASDMWNIEEFDYGHCSE